MNLKGPGGHWANWRQATEFFKTGGTIESIGSSTRIEGSKFSNQQVEALLSNLVIQKLTTRDEQEVAGYAEIMNTVFQHSTDIQLTENYIKQLHRDLPLTGNNYPKQV